MRGRMVDGVRTAVHFVGFKSIHDQRYGNAVRVFGLPDFLHRRWDTRARREIMAEDTIVFANGDATQPASPHSGDDEAYS